MRERERAMLKVKTNKKMLFFNAMMNNALVRWRQREREDREQCFNKFSEGTTGHY